VTGVKENILQHVKEFYTQKNSNKSPEASWPEHKKRPAGLAGLIY
jgi:hypothetical protein